MSLTFNDWDFSGVFTAPKAGTYSFSTHARADNSNGYLRMKKNDTVLCEMWVTENQGLNIPSGSIVTHLDLGDQIKVTGDDRDKATITQNGNGFSGFLINSD